MLLHLLIPHGRLYTAISFYFYFFKYKLCQYFLLALSTSRGLFAVLVRFKSFKMEFKIKLT